MKKSILVMLLCAVGLGACGGNAALNPADVAQAIANGCLVVQPTLAATSTAVPNPQLALASTVNGVFCSANEAAAAAAVASAAKAASAPAAAPAAAPAVPASTPAAPVSLHIFKSGEVLTAEELNRNFAALAAK